MPDFQAPINSVLRTAAAAKVLKDRFDSDPERKMSILTGGLEVPTPMKTASRYDKARRLSANAKAKANVEALKSQKEELQKTMSGRKEEKTDGQQRKDV